MAKKRTLAFCLIRGSETGYESFRDLFLVNGMEASRLSSFHPIKFKCALRQSVDLWPRAVFAQLESLTSFGFFHIRVPLAVLFPCTGQCAQAAVRGDGRPAFSVVHGVPCSTPSGTTFLPVEPPSLYLSFHICRERVSTS